MLTLPRILSHLRQSELTRSHNDVNWVAQTTIPDKTLLQTQEAGPTHQDELTQFREAEEEVTVQSAVESSFMHDSIDNPYPTQVPTSILSRNFRVLTFSWGPSYTTQTLDFPYCLLQQESIGDALASFLYFRGDVRVEVRMNTTPFHYGALMCSWLPYTNVTGSINVFQASGNRPVVLSASTQQAATIDIPWTSPETWCNWVACANDTLNQTAFIGRLMFHQLVPLTTTSSSISDTVIIQVFASFQNPRVAGYVPSSSTRVAKEKLKERRKSLPKAWQESGPFRTQSKSQEAVVKSKDQTMVSDVVDGTIAPIMRSLGSFGDSVVNAASALFSGGKFLGLFDKPRSLSSVQVYQVDYSKGHAQADGLYEGQSLGMYQFNKLGSSSNMMGGESSDMTINQFVGLPMLHRIIPFTTANQTDSATVIDPYYYNNAFGQLDYLMFASTCFNYWRGSIKYMIQFITTAFTTARFRISVNYVSYSSAVTTTGDVVSRIVDVKGDTITEFTVPYLYNTHWRTIGTTGLADTTSPRLSIEVLEDIVGQSIESDATVYVILWRAAGEDFQFQQLQSPLLNESLDLAEEQTSIRDRFRVPFEGIVKGVSGGVEHNFISSEAPVTIKDCLKRFSSNSDFITTLPFNCYQFDLFPFWSNVFNYFRGSRRLKSIYSASAGIASIYPTNTYSALTGGSLSGCGYAYTQCTEYNQLSTEIPWFSTLPYYPTLPAISAMNSTVAEEAFPSDFAVIASPNLTFLSAGDDFQYGFVVAPAPISTVRKRVPLFLASRQRKKKSARSRVSTESPVASKSQASSLQATGKTHTDV